MCNSIRLDDHGNDDDDNGGCLVMRKEYGRFRLPACLVLACPPQPHGDSRETVDEDDDLLSCGQPFIYPMKVYVADLARVRVCPVYVVVGFAADAEGGQGSGLEQRQTGTNRGNMAD